MHKSGPLPHLGRTFFGSFPDLGRIFTAEVRRICGGSALVMRRNIEFCSASFRSISDNDSVFNHPSKRNELWSPPKNTHPWSQPYHSTLPPFPAVHAPATIPGQWKCSTAENLSCNVLASYGMLPKNVDVMSWKYGCFVPIFAPLRKGGTAERPLTTGKETRRKRGHTWMSCIFWKSASKLF